MALLGLPVAARRSPAASERAGRRQRSRAASSPRCAGSWSATPSRSSAAWRSGSALARSRLLRDSIGTLVTGLQALPSICWLPLALFWFGLSERRDPVRGRRRLAARDHRRHRGGRAQRAAALHARGPHDGRARADALPARHPAGGAARRSSRACGSAGPSRGARSWRASCSSSRAGSASCSRRAASSTTWRASWR